MENSQLSNNYEIRSSDMQELMKKPPHKFILWGTIWVLVFLVFVFYVLNQFYILDKTTSQVKVLQVTPFLNNKKAVGIIVSAGALSSGENIINHNASLHLASDTSGSVPLVVEGRIDSVVYTEYGESILYIGADNDLINVKKGMIGHVEIEAGKKTYLVKLLESTFKK